MRPASEAESQPNFERIVPRAVSAPAAAVSAGGKAASTSHISGAKVAIGLVVILLLGALSIFVLPRLTVPPATTTESPAAPPVAKKPLPAATTPPAPAPSPAKPIWDDPAMLQTRAAAQDLQRRFEDEAGKLRATAVDRWGAEDFAKAEALAKTAGAAFVAKDFAAAKSGYEAATAATTALIAQGAARLTSSLAAGAAALDRGDKAAAQAAFELAAAIDPGNALATRGLARVQTLDTVRAKLETARRLEQLGDEAGAVASYRAALQLDADTTEATQALARIAAARSDAEFRQALGEAIAAIDRGNLGLAETHLARARALRANDPGVNQAAARIAEGRRGSRLGQLQSEAAAQVAVEDWAGAITTYRAALQLDGSVAFAREGLAVAEPRAALALKLQGLITRPERLNASAVAAEAEALLIQARATAPAGPRLQQQIAELRRALDVAAQPVEVALQSDAQTEVLIYKVGPQGRFDRKTLALKPGHYVAVGTRAGYVDVRVEFDVAPGLSPVIIRCEEKL